MAARAGLVPKNELYYIFDILTYCRNDSYGYMSLGEGKVIIVQLILFPGKCPVELRVLPRQSPVQLRMLAGQSFL